MNLHEDSVKLLDFIDKDQQKTTKIEKEMDQRVNEHKSVQNSLKDLDQKINTSKGEIDKNKEMLSQYDKHKKFLMALYMNDDQEWYDKYMLKHTAKETRLKDRWIQ